MCVCVYVCVYVCVCVFVFPMSQHLFMLFYIMVTIISRHATLFLPPRYLYHSHDGSCKVTNSHV